MPDFSDFPALDVAIGLILVYLVLSLIVSGIGELISRVLSWRAKYLEEGIRNLLNDPDGTGKAKEVLEQPLVRGLQRNGATSDPKGANPPSYIPSKVFAAALFDTIAPPAADTEQNRDVIAAAAASIVQIENAQLRKTLLTLLQNARGDLDQFRRGIEEWYDAAMDRVTGWYKRHLQRILLVLGIVAAIALNADSFQIANTLWNDGTVRAAVASEATEVAKKDPSQDAEQRLKKAADEVNQLKALKLPIGWSDTKGDPRDAPKLFSWDMLWKLLGIIITGFAVSLGAPFWFDTLGKAVRLRSSGPRPKPAET